MQHVVSITGQGQMTVPKLVLKQFNINGATKAILERKGDILTVRPKRDFWQLAGSFKTSISLSNQQLKEARNSFAVKWPQK